MAKSKEELIYDIENNLVDPTTNKITGDRVKARLLDMVDAMGQGGGASQMKYYRVEPQSAPDAAELIYILGSLLKVYATSDASNIHIQPPVMCGDPFSPDSHFTIMGGAFDMSLRLVASGLNMTIGEYIDFMLDAMEIGSLEDIGAFEITEEEFYTI